MAFNLEAMAEKIKRYREQLQYSLSEVSKSTGISIGDLEKIETGKLRPTGDQVLILADFFKCDYKFFLSNEKLASFEETEVLFRRFGDEFGKEDRRAVQEFLFLAENEAYLEKILGKQPLEHFNFVKRGSHFKTHGQEAAQALRKFLKYRENEVSMNIFKDMRRIGIRVYRRKLKNSNISGLYINHPVAGQCVLINYSEDSYRQRFTAAHETAHTILDKDDDVLVSFSWDKKSLKEVRANSFASAYLIPPEFLIQIPDAKSWSKEKLIKWSNNFKVSTQALAIALRANNLISDQTYSEISSVRVPNELKEDPELPSRLSENSKNRKKMLLEHGLSGHYVSLCFESYNRSFISAARLAEILLLESDQQLVEISELYGESLKYAT